MKNIFVFIGLSLLFYWFLFYMVKGKKIKSGNNNFKIIIPIVTVLSISNILLSMKYNFSTKILSLILQKILPVIIFPIYYAYLKLNIKISKVVELLFMLFGFVLFFQLVIISGIRSLVFPALYLIVEFIQANNINNIKNMNFNFSISCIEFFNKLPQSDKRKYRDPIIKMITVFFAIIAMTMITISNIGFIYQMLFIIFISFMFTQNIKNEKLKIIFDKSRK